MSMQVKKSYDDWLMISEVFFVITSDNCVFYIMNRLLKHSTYAPF